MHDDKGFILPKLSRHLKQIENYADGLSLEKFDVLAGYSMRKIIKC